MTGFLLIHSKVLTSALESALEWRVPLLGNARSRDHFQSKDRGRISRSGEIQGFENSKLETIKLF